MTRRLGTSLALAAIVAGGAPVAAQSPAASAALIAHPDGATDVVLRMDTGGGFVPVTYRMTQAPEFTLYGDGTVVFRPAVDPEGDGLPPFVQATMTETEMDALLLYALDPGGLRDAREAYMHRQITDQPTTIFSIDADGVDKAVAVYALGRTQPEGADAAAYESFQALGAVLSDFGQQVAAGHAQDPQLFQPTEYRAFLSPALDPTASAIPWPWPDLTMDDFQPYAAEDGVLIGGLTPEQASQVTTVPSGGVLATPIQTPDGTTVTLTLRPLLPGEVVDPAAPAAS